MAVAVGKASGQDYMDVRGHRRRSLRFSPVNLQFFCCFLLLRVRKLPTIIPCEQSDQSAMVEIYCISCTINSEVLNSVAV